MDSLTEDLWAIILARLPLKTIATSKLVCKQWKSILESQCLRELFMSHHQNSQPSWSLMCRDDSAEDVVAQYGCDIWGLPRSLGSYVTSFINARFQTKKRKLRLCPQKVRVLAYTEVRLILIYVTSSVPWSLVYYVANPISRQCLKIPPLPVALVACGTGQVYTRATLVTRTENDTVSGYKVVLIYASYKATGCFLTFIIYSSETGLWSSKTLRSPLLLVDLNLRDHITLNGSLHWLGFNLDSQKVVVSFDFYGSDNQCRVIPFPDSGKEPNFQRCCTTSQGNLMYMNVFSENKDDGSVEHKLSVWRLKNEEWQLVSEISPDFIETGSDYLPLGVNPFDGYTMYLWSEMYDSLASINLRNGNSRVHKVLERSRNGQTLSYARRQGEVDAFEWLYTVYFSTFVLPGWLYRIPQPPQAEKSL